MTWGMYAIPDSPNQAVEVKVITDVCDGLSIDWELERRHGYIAVHCWPRVTALTAPMLFAVCEEPTYWVP